MKTIAAFMIGTCLLGQLAWAERPMNELPMYGGQHNPAVERNVDFSREATQRGWKAYYQGDFDTAIKRFNQGWMFDRDNPEVYWGFGLIMGQRASIGNPESSLKESIRFLEMANVKAPEDGRIIGDLAFSHTVLGQYFQSNRRANKKAQGHFETAGELFSKAYTKAPTYPPITANWSVFFFYTGNFEKAKAKVDEAFMLGYRFSPNYIEELESNLKYK
jgi:tetratricopeptide (TPR) repeat protein